MREKFYLIQISLLFLILPNNLIAQVTISTSTDWSLITTGSGPGGLPSSTDDVIIDAPKDSTTTLTVDIANAVCLSLTIAPTGNPSTSILSFNNGSQLTVSGTVTLGGINASRVGSIDMTSGGTLICNGFSLTAGAGTFTHGAGTVELTATNTLPSTVFTTFNNLTIGSGTTTLGVNIALTGNWTNNSSAVLTSYTVTFNGSSAQTIGGTSSTTFDNLTIDNSSTGVTLNTDETVNGILTLTDGLLTLGSSNLTLGGTASISGTPAASNMVVATGTGELRKTYTAIGSFTFPVGDNTSTAEYSPVTLNFTSGSFASAYAGVRLINGKHPNNTSTSDFISRYWTVTSSGITSFSCNATCQYVDADISGTEANLYCGTWNGSGWTLLNAVNTATNELSGTVTSFSDFTGGEQLAMPVELIFLDASVTKTGVLIKWKTETEVNNFGFEIERNRSPNSSSGKWKSIGFVNGNGNSNSPIEYSFSDNQITSRGRYHYRLRQVDFDGTFEYSDPVSVDISASQNLALHQNYPNPFNPSTIISFELTFESKVVLVIYNALGERIKTLTSEVYSSGKHELLFDGNRFPSGIYFYSLQVGEQKIIKKMLLVK